jgi:flagellar biosynthesis protein FlhB
VPIVRNLPLECALRRTVELSTEAPPAHHRAASEVIGQVLRLQRRR